MRRMVAASSLANASVGESKKTAARAGKRSRRIKPPPNHRSGERWPNSTSGKVGGCQKAPPNEGGSGSVTVIRAKPGRDTEEIGETLHGRGVLCDGPGQTAGFQVRRV